MHMDKFSDPLPDGTKLLQGQYHIKEFLNDGGFGITYLASDSLDRSMVIKECFPRAIGRRSGLEVGTRAISHREEFRSIVKAFVEEARNLSKFEHPNIVKVHQVFDENQTAYMAMDYIDGQELITAIEQDVLSPDLVISIAGKLLDALQNIHANGMLHRDISPDNILLDQSGNPILIDFGAAKEEASLHGPKMTSIRVTKEGYSPQEFYVSGAQQFPSSDLYAFAATLYHAITGHAPVESQARLLALAQEKPDPYVPISGQYNAYPAGLLKAIDLALNVSPKDRLASAQEWLDLINVPVRPEVTPRKSHASKRILVGIMSAAVLAVGVGIWYSNGSQPITTNPQPAKVAVLNTDGFQFQAPKVSHSQDWTLELPFTVKADVNNGVEIDSVENWYKPVSASNWIISGVRMASVNGRTLTDINTLKAALVLSKKTPYPDTLTANVTYFPNGKTETKTGQLQLNATRSYDFSNGMKIRQQFRGSGWQLVVITPPSSPNADVKHKDVLLAERVLGQAVTTLDQLLDILKKLEDRNLPKGVFSVQRDGAIVLANLPLKGKSP